MKPPRSRSRSEEALRGGRSGARDRLHRRGRRDLRIPRPQWRGQDDDHQDPLHAPAGDVGHGAAGRARRGGVSRGGPAADRRHFPGPGARRSADRRREPDAARGRLPRPARRSPRAHRRGAAVRRSLRASQGSGPHLLGRHEASAGDRARAGPPPGHPVPGRADHRPGSADARPHLGGAARPAKDLRHDAVPDHPLHGRGRELRSDRHRRPRPHRRARHAGRAQAAGRQGSG